MAATKTAALPKTVETASFLDAGQVVGVSTKTGYERGSVVTVTGAYIAINQGETQVAIPWSHIVKVESV